MDRNSECYWEWGTHWEWEGDVLGHWECSALMRMLGIWVYMYIKMGLCVKFSILCTLYCMFVIPY